MMVIHLAPKRKHLRMHTSLGGGFLRQRCRVAVVWQVIVGLPMNYGRALGHGGLVWDVRWPLSVWMGRQLVGHVSWVLHGRRWVVVWRERIVRSLPQHVVSAAGIRRLAHGWPCLVASVVHVWWCKLRAPLLRWHIGIVRPRSRRHRRHAVPWHKGLRLWIEGVPVEAARDGMLALGIMWIDVDRKRSVCIRDSTSWCGGSGPRLIRALVEAWWWRRRRRRLLPPMWLWGRRLHRRTIRPWSYRGHRRLIARLARGLGILLGRQRVVHSNGNLSMTNVRHVVILLRTIGATRHHRRVRLVGRTVHRRHWGRVLLLLSRAAELSGCRNILWLNPGRLVRMSIRRCVSHIVGPSLKGVGVAPSSHPFPAIGLVPQRYRARARHPSAVFIIWRVVSAATSVL